MEHAFLVKMCENCTYPGCHMNGTCLDQDKCKSIYYYNPDCNSNCEKNCDEKGCDMKGQCRGNCTYDHFSRPLCNEVCNSNCEGHKCRDSDGYCFNCIDHTFYGNYCNISVGEDGTELQNCEKAEQDGETCTVCKHNIYFGQKCENECS